MAESKAAVTRIAPNGIFSQVKTSAYFKTTQQTPTLTSLATSIRLGQQQNNSNSAPPQISQQQRPSSLQPKPSITKSQAPQRRRPPPPPTTSSSSSQQNRPTFRKTPLFSRLAKNAAYTLPPPLPTPLPTKSRNLNATIILEADITTLRAAPSSSNIMNSTKIDDICNLQPIIPPLPLVAPKLTITQMVNAVEQSNLDIVVTNKEIQVLTNKIENKSIIILTSNDEMKLSPSASIEMKTPGSSASNNRQQTSKMQPSGNELNAFLNSGRDEEVKKSTAQKETKLLESELDAVVVKDSKYFRNLVRKIFKKF